jgi:hypothetical protein
VYKKGDSPLLDKVDDVRGLFGSAVLGVIGVAAVLTGGTAGWAVGAVFLAGAVAGVVHILRGNR